MKKYLIFPKDYKINEQYRKEFIDTEECRHWIINHLDLSKEWTFKEYK